MFDVQLMMPLANLESTPTPAGGGAATGPAPAMGVEPAHNVVVTTTPGPAVQQGLVASTQAAGTQLAVKEAPPASPFSGLLTMAPIILMLVALYFFMMRGQKKEEKRRKSLLSEMKRGDKVQTIGGLVARIVSIDNDEVVLKVDESANVKATYKKSAILNVIVAGDEKTK